MSVRRLTSVPVDVVEAVPCAPFLSAAMLAEGGIFDRHYTTVYKWAASGKLPAPDLVLSGKPHWAVATIRVWAAGHRLRVDEDALARICDEQLPNG